MLRKAASAVVISALLLSGCQTTNPYTGEQEVNKTSKYAGAGALAGAVVGGLVDGKDGALKGAAIGGATGGGYGYYVDQQEKKLRVALQNTGVQVKRQGDNLQLIMPSNITFDTGKATIKPSFKPVLESVAQVFEEFDKNGIQVVGYTDSSGGDKINIPLSKERANNVATYIQQLGVSGSRIIALGRGSADPIASNATAAGKAANRRVEINLLPPAQA
ncbi:MAG: OmpA family protein [Endozoicomonas sp. (ex Botrylloides leachii)]|nr:OmpA family protein [Endozoicomonas sp. (ex Botrylloides leachii)]